MNNVLVTGGAGFIGSFLCERLLEQDNNVTVFDNLSTGNKENIKHLSKEGKVEFSAGSILDELLLESLELVDGVSKPSEILDVVHRRDVAKLCQDPFLDIVPKPDMSRIGLKLLGEHIDFFGGAYSNDSHAPYFRGGRVKNLPLEAKRVLLEAASLSPLDHPMRRHMPISWSQSAR